MILPDISTASQYLPSINLTVDNLRLTDFFLRAENWVANKILGTQLQEELNDPIQDIYEEGELSFEPEDPYEDLRKLVQRLIAVRAYLTAIPEMDLQLSEAGFVVQSNEYMAPASKERTNGLIEGLKMRQMEDADALTLYLWKHSDPNNAESEYTDWRDSAQFRFLTSAFCPFSYIYNQVSPVQHRVRDWEDFHDNIALMASALDNEIASYISEEEIENLLEDYRGNDLEQHQHAVVKRLVKAEAASVRGDSRSMIASAIEARSIMVKNPDEFEAFAHSDCRNLPTMNIGNLSAANFL